MERQYLDETGLARVADKVKARLKAVTVMPASADDGAVRLYVGETTASYTKGHIYEYDNDTWTDISPSGGGSNNYNELNNKPQINDVVLIGNKDGRAYRLANITDLPVRTAEVFSYTINCFCVFNDTLYLGTESHGIYTSTDGITFTQNASFYAHTSVKAMCEYKGMLCVGAATSGFYTSTDGINFTQNTSVPTNYSISALCVYNNTLYVSTRGIYTSTDGSTFTQNTSFPTNYTPSAFYEYNDTLYVGTVTHGIYTSTDGSTFTQNWSLSNTYTIKAFCEYKNTLYVGLGNSSFGGRGIYTSTDGSTFIQNTSFPTTEFVNTLYVYAGKLYVGINSVTTSVYESTDGSTFTAGVSFPTYNVYAFCVYKDILYIGTNGGLYNTRYTASNCKTLQTPVTSPITSGNTLAFIDTISQNANGEITATKKSITIDDALSDTSTNPVQNSVIKAALDDTKKTFLGTRAEWDALTAAEKKQYDICNLTDDVAGGEMIVSDEVTEGDYNLVTSNAVAKKITLKSISITAVIGATATVTTSETSFAEGQFVRVQINPGVTLSEFWGTASALSNLGVANIQVAGSVGSSSRLVVALGVIRKSGGTLYLDIFG